MFIRNLTRSHRHFFLPGLTVLLGIAVLTFTNSIVASVQSYISERSAELLGGDIRLDSSFPIDTPRYPIIEELKDAGAVIEEVMIVNAMISSDQSESLSRVKIVGTDHPLYGTVETVSENGFSVPGPNDILLDRDSAETLQVNVDDRVRLGTADYTVSDIIIGEPDLGGGFFSFGGKAILSETGFARSGIDRTASRTSYELRIRLPQAADFANVQQEMNATFGESAIDVDFASENAESLPDSVAEFGKFLDVLSVMLLLIAMAAIYLGSGLYLDGQKKVIAIYRAFGRDTLAIAGEYAGVIMIWCGLYGLIGSISGSALATAAIGQIAPTLAIPLVPAFAPADLWTGFLLAAGIGLCGSALRLSAIFTISPRTLISGSADDSNLSAQRNQSLLLVFICIALFLLFWFLLEDAVLALGAIGGFVLMSALSVLLIGLAFLLLGRSKKYFSGFYALRTTLSFFLRPQGGIGLSLSMLLISFFAVCSVWIIAQSLLKNLQQNITDSAPALVVLDVQQDQVEAVEAMLPSLELYPIIRARIIAKNGEDIRRNEEGEILRAFNLSFADSPDPRETLTAGSFWEPGNTRQEVSVEQEYAERFEIGLGDTMTFDIAGIPLTAEVTSIRERDTAEIRPWFAFLFPVAVLKDAPATSFGFLDADPARVPQIRTELVRAFPNLSVVSTQDVADKIIPTLESIATATKLFAVIMLINGFVVLSILLAAGSRQRKKDFWVFRIFGATGGWITRAYSMEVLLSIAIAWTLGFLFSLVAGFVLIRFFFELDAMAFPLVPLGIGLVVAVLAVVVRGRSLGILNK